MAREMRITWIIARALKELPHRLKERSVKNLPWFHFLAVAEWGFCTGRHMTGEFEKCRREREDKDRKEREERRPPAPRARVPQGY